MCYGVGGLGVEAIALLQGDGDSVGREGGTLMRWVRERMVSSIFSGLSLTSRNKVLSNGSSSSFKIAFEQASFMR